MEHTILYVHGMGGGGDSRIPSILSEKVNSSSPEGRSIRVVVRTYPFNPAEGWDKVSSWYDSLRPSLVIGESMGAVHALALEGVPHIMVSPAIGVAPMFTLLSHTVFIPGVTPLCDWIWKPREGDRQALHFTRENLSGWMQAQERFLSRSPLSGSKDYFFAFFGKRDHYRKYSVVNISKWKKYYGEDSCFIYNGSHFMENEYVESLLIPKIHEVLGNVEKNL